MSLCNEPQAHPDRCGCQLRRLQQPGPIWNGISVKVNDFLPPKTMMVSRDVYELLKREVPKA